MMNIRRHVINMASVSVDSSTNSYSPSDPRPTNNNNVVVGLNGALQKRFILPNNHCLVPGNVHRATNVDFGVGGKGQDVAIALNCLNRRERTDDQNDNDDATYASSSSNIRLLQFIGTGSAGDIVHNLLRDRLGENAMEFTVRSSSEMRTCTSIVSFDTTTELVEPSGRITEEELEELFSIVSCNRNNPSESSKKNESVRSLCIMGSMPPGCPEDTYARIYAQLAGPNTVCVVDSLAGTGPLFQTISGLNNGDDFSVAAGPLLFKVNASELCKLGGTSKSNNEVQGITMSDLTNAIAGFLSKYSITAKNDNSSGIIGLAITDGKHDAYFVTFNDSISQEEQLLPSPSFRVFQLPVPNLDHENSGTLYPIGAGDAVAAGTVAAWTSLTATDVKINPSVVPEDSLASLVVFVEKILDHCSESSIEVATVQAQAVAAFAFGLACGSASCLKEENSFVDVSDANRLFQEISICSPKIILSS